MQFFFIYAQKQAADAIQFVFLLSRCVIFFHIYRRVAVAPCNMKQDDKLIKPVLGLPCFSTALQQPSTNLLRLSNYLMKRLDYLIYHLSNHVTKKQTISIFNY